MEKLTATNYVDLAEDVIKNMLQTDRRGNKSIALTSSQIRNLLSLVNSVYIDAVDSKSEKLRESLQGKVQYLRVRFVYAAGREKAVEEFVKKAHIISYLKAIGDNKENLLFFCKYMEALVAYHKFYGGRD